jgi:hypothetical protein
MIRGKILFLISSFKEKPENIIKILEKSIYSLFLKSKYSSDLPVIIMEEDELKAWKEKYPFLEELIENTKDYLVKIEEWNIKKHLKDKIVDYFDYGSDEYFYTWYGVKDGKTIDFEGEREDLKKTTVRQVLIRDKYDFMFQTCLYVREFFNKEKKQEDEYLEKEIRICKVNR